MTERILQGASKAAVAVALIALGLVADASETRLPDGLTQPIPVILRVSGASPFTVPAGRNLYIFNAMQVGHGCGGLSGSCHLTASGSANILDASGTWFANPIILGPGTVVASTSSAVAFDLNGFVVVARVETVLRELAPGSSYAVPAGSLFYLMRIGRPAPASGQANLIVGGVGLFPGTDPVPVPGGVSIVNSGNSPVTLIGYLERL